MYLGFWFSGLSYHLATNEMVRHLENVARQITDSGHSILMENSYILKVSGDIRTNQYQVTLHKDFQETLFYDRNV